MRSVYRKWALQKIFIKTAIIVCSRTKTVASTVGHVAVRDETNLTADILRNGRCPEGQRYDPK